MSDGSPSVGKTSGQTQYDTTVDGSLHVLHQTHRETTLLFVMTTRHGVTDAEIVEALFKVLHHLSGHEYFQDTSPVCGDGHSEDNTE
jgi:hypothetical protein